MEKKRACDARMRRTSGRAEGEDAPGISVSDGRRGRGDRGTKTSGAAGACRISGSVGRREAARRRVWMRVRFVALRDSNRPHRAATGGGEKREKATLRKGNLLRRAIQGKNLPDTSSVRDAVFTVRDRVCKKRASVCINQDAVCSFRGRGGEKPPACGRVSLGEVRFILPGTFHRLSRRYPCPVYGKSRRCVFGVSRVRRSANKRQRERFVPSVC